MEVLLAVDAVSSDANLKALRRLYDTVEAQVRGLKAMGVTAETYGGLLSSVMLSKVPPEIRLIISRAIGDGDRKLDGLMKLLLDELQARERSVAGEFTPVKAREKRKVPQYCSGSVDGKSRYDPYLLLLPAGTPHVRVQECHVD